MEGLPPLYVPPFDIVEEAIDPGPGACVHVVCDEILVHERWDDLVALANALVDAVLEPSGAFWENEHLIGTLRPGFTFEDFRIWVIRWWRENAEGLEPEFFVPPFCVGSIGEFDEPEGIWIVLEPEVLDAFQDEVLEMFASLLRASRVRPGGKVGRLATRVKWVLPSRVEIPGGTGTDDSTSEELIRDWLSAWWYHNVGAGER